MIKNDPKNYITIGMAQANSRAEWLAELANRSSTPSTLSGANPMTIETELPAVKVGDGMAFFTANVDRWGAAEWFDRLAKAIREQDNAVRAKDDISFEIFRSIAASSAMTLVREFEEQVRSALTLKDDPGKRSEADGE